MHEDIPILNFLVPKEFTHENGRLTGMVFEKVKAEYDAKGRRNLVPTGEPDEHFPCDDVLVAVGQENAFPWIERDIGIEFDKWDMPVVDHHDHAVDPSQGVLRRRPAFGPKNIIWAVAHGHDAAISIDKHVPRRGRSPTARCPSVEICSQKMGIHEWSYDNEISLDKRYRVPLRDKAIALQGHQGRGRARLRPAARARRGAALPELRRADGVHRQALHRVRRLRRHLPDGLHHLHRERRGGRAAHAAEGAGQQPDAGPLRRRRSQDRPRHGQGRGRLPALRPVRRALPDRRLGHAEIPDRYDSRGMQQCRIEERKRFRRPVRQRQRLGLGERQRAVRARRAAHGRAGRAAQHLPLQHPGPADLVRGADHRKPAISARAAASTSWSR